MRFFGRAHRLPRDVAQRFARYGRLELLGPASGEDPMAVFAAMAPVRQYAADDHDAYVSDVLALNLPEESWAAYGAGRSAWDMLRLRETPEVLKLINNGIAFLRRHGVPPMQVCGYEWKRWISAGGTIESWLPTRTPPKPEDAKLPDLEIGAELLVARVAAADDANKVIIRRTGPDTYEWVTDARQNESDPTRTRWVNDSAASVYDLFYKIGRILQTPPDGYSHPALEPFFPLRRPSLPQ